MTELLDKVVSNDNFSLFFVVISMSSSICISCRKQPIMEHLFESRQTWNKEKKLKHLSSTDHLYYYSQLSYLRYTLGLQVLL